MLKTVSSIVNAIGALNYKDTWNASTNLVHIGVGPTAAAAQANAVAATAGNPAAGIPLVAGAVEILRFSAGPLSS